MDRVEEIRKQHDNGDFVADLNGDTQEDVFEAMDFLFATIDQLRASQTALLEAVDSLTELKAYTTFGIADRILHLKEVAEKVREGK